jgi:DNA-binding protein
MTNVNVPILPIAPVERIVRKAGADRVSEDAGIELAKVLEEYGLEVSREAISLAKHAKRTTVKEEDVRLANDRLKRYGEKSESVDKDGDMASLLNIKK